MELTSNQIERYARQIALDEVGEEGQKKLLESRVLVIGAGGLGSPILMYLAAAGVGTIGIADFDNVDLSNLQRQIIHNTSRLGEPKAESAKETVLSINPDVKVKVYKERIHPKNIVELISEYDFIIEATDNFQTKFLVNDACVMSKKPFSHGGILRFSGQLMTYVPNKSCCYRCIFKEPPPKDSVPTCRQAGIIGAVPGIIGSLQAMEAIKYLLGKGDLLTSRLLTFDALKMEFHTIKFPEKVSDCPICRENQTITELIDYEPTVYETQN